MSLKNTLKLPKLISRRLKTSVHIRRIDEICDQLMTYDSSGLIEGYKKTTIDHILDSPGLTEKMIRSDLHVRPDEVNRVYYSWDIPAFLWDAMLKSATLETMVKCYLGPRARLDDFYVKSVMDGLDSVSEGWHDDNVGYRLKVFMVFDVERDPAGTLLVPARRPNLYRTNVKDELTRFIFKPSKGSRKNSIAISYEKGDCLVFDTNLLHRGDYSRTKGVRYCVIAEFIDRDKADAIVGRSPCGPGQGRLQLKIPALDGIDLRHHFLIDHSILRPTQQGYLYGYPKIS